LGSSLYTKFNFPVTTAPAAWVQFPSPNVLFWHLFYNLVSKDQPWLLWSSPQISGWRPPPLEQSDLFAASVRRLYPKGMRRTPPFVMDVTETSRNNILSIAKEAFTKVINTMLCEHLSSKTSPGGRQTHQTFDKFVVALYNT
jgi:hypothetical protein